MGYNIYMSSDNTELVKCLTKLLSLRKVNEFCAKLSAIAKRQGGFSKLSNEMSLNRESLYKALSGKRDPRFSTNCPHLSRLARVMPESQSSLIPQTVA